MADEFVLAVDLTGQGPVDVMFEDPAEGPHKIRIEGCRLEKSGKGSLRFTVTDLEDGSPTKGIVTQVIIGTDFTKTFNKGHLVNAYLSIGAKPDRLTGQLDVKPGHFIGKDAYMYVRKAPEGEVDEATGRAKQASKNFLTPQQYEAAKRAQAALGSRPAPAAVLRSNTSNGSSVAQPGPAPQPSASVPAPTPAAAPPADAGLGDLFG